MIKAVTMRKQALQFTMTLKVDLSSGTEAVTPQPRESVQEIATHRVTSV